MNLGGRVEGERSGGGLVWGERWRSSRVCAGLHSPPVRRSFDKEIGATRVVVVIVFTLPRIARSAADLRRFALEQRKWIWEFSRERGRRYGENRGPAHG